MRPDSIKWFDRLFLTALALGVPFSVLETWQAAVSKPHLAFYWWGQFAAQIIIGCSFWFFISRRASNIAKWAWILSLAFEMIGLPLLSIMAGGDFIEAFWLYGTMGATAEVIRLLLSVGAAVMLFRTDAAKWFASRGKLFDASTFS